MLVILQNRLYTYRVISLREQHYINNSTRPHVHHYYCVQAQKIEMVLHTFIDCSNHSDRDKDVTYYKIPSLITHTHDECDLDVV